MKSNIWSIGTIIIVLILGAIVGVGRVRDKKIESVYVPKPVATATSEPKATVIPIETPKPGWMTFRSNRMGIRFSYPKRMRVGEQMDGAIGASLVDGFSMIFETGVYDEEFDDFVSDQVSAQVGALERVKFEKVEGYKFGGESLSEDGYYLISKEAGDVRYIYVLVLVEDQGFGEIVDEILNSVEFL